METSTGFKMYFLMFLLFGTGQADSKKYMKEWKVKNSKDFLEGKEQAGQDLSYAGDL